MNSKRTLCLTSLTAILWFSTSFSAYIFLDEVMTREEQYKTGMQNLTAKQKTELEKWINANFELKNQPQEAPQKEISLSLNIDDGKKLRLSDGSLYEVAPTDTVYSASWITPFPLKITDSGDTEYPYKITNSTTGTSVKARQIEPPSS